MLKLYSAESIIDAQLLHHQLSEKGIDAMIKGTYLTGAIGELPPDQLVSIWISDPGQEEPARQIVREFERNRQAVVEDIECPHCHEMNQSSFGFCWSCGERLEN